MIGDKARAILVFPNIVKAGFLVGGQYDEGAIVQAGQNGTHGVHCWMQPLLRSMYSAQ